MKKCKICGNEIHPTRLKILPDTETCIECSSIKAKHGVPILFGQKDDTWVDLVFMGEDEYKLYENSKKKLKTGDCDVEEKPLKSK